MTLRSELLALLVLPSLAGCMTLPTGPSVMVWPGSGKAFDEFRGDNALCQQYGEERVSGMTPHQASTRSVSKSAVTGAVIGASAGAAIGGARGAGVGAGSGLLLGSLAGSHVGAVSADAVQQRYDIAYMQCMYAKGHQVPVAAVPASARVAQAPQPGLHPPPPPDFYPRPSPGPSPPPPPGWNPRRGRGP